VKSLIAYYSFSGNTDRAVKIFAGILRNKGEVDLRRLKPKDETSSFLSQCRAARSHKRAELEGGAVFDASLYDILLIGSPVWAFAPTPAMNAYLDGLSGLNGKRVIVLLTSGSGLGVKHCFKHIRSVLENKGAARIDEINIPDRKQSDREFISSSLERIL
jgi:flavodoxin